MEVSSQSVFQTTVSTDKATYTSGETIVVTVRIRDDRGVPGVDTLWGSSNSLVRILFDEVRFQDTFSKDSVPYVMHKQSGIIWTWRLEPVLLGIPTFDGVHTVTAYVPGYPTVTDTTSFSSPAFRGES